MNTMIFALLALAQAHAADVVNLPVQRRLENATYACTVKGAAKRLRADARYTVTYFEERSGEQFVPHVQLSASNGRMVDAVAGELDEYQPVRNTLFSKNPEFLTLKTKDETYATAKAGVAFLGTDNRYETDELECQAVETPEVAESVPSFFDCVTDKPFEGKRARIRFALAFMDHPRAITAVPMSEKDAEDGVVVRVTPKSSSLSSLDDNFTVSLGKDRIEMRGDADGVYLVDLVLYRGQDYQTGYVRTRSGDSTYKPSYSTLTCSVAKGN